MNELSDKEKLVKESIVKLYTFESSQRAINLFKEVSINVTKETEHKTMIEIGNNLLSYKNNPDIVELRGIIAKNVIENNKYPF